MQTEFQSIAKHIANMEEGANAFSVAVKMLRAYNNGLINDDQYMALHKLLKEICLVQNITTSNEIISLF